MYYSCFYWLNWELYTCELMIGIMTTLYFLYFCNDNNSIILNGGIIFVKDFIYCFVCCQKNYYVTLDYA